MSQLEIKALINGYSSAQDIADSYRDECDELKKRIAEALEYVEILENGDEKVEYTEQHLINIIKSILKGDKT